MNNKKMLLITWNYPPKVGGMEQLLYQLVQEINQDLDVSVIAPHEIHSKEESQVYRAPQPGLAKFFLFAFFKGFRLIKEKKIDFILGGSALVTPVIFLLSKVKAVPGTVYVHGLDLIYENWLYQFVLARLLPGLDHYFANSNQTKEIACQKRVGEDKISVLHPGIKTEDYDLLSTRPELREKYGLAGRKVLFYAGRLARRKGLLEFVKYSFPDIVAQHPDIYLCVVGDNPASSLSHTENIRDLVEREITTNGLSDYAKFFGWVERETLLELYTACDIFFLPAIYVEGDMEGFGIVLAEANASRRPVVSTLVGGIPDAVENGVTALLVPPGDWQAFSDALLTLLDDDQKRQQMGEAGFQRTRELLDWDVIGKQFIEIAEKRIIRPERNGI